MTDDDCYILDGDRDFMRESMRRFIADELEKFKANKKTQDYILDGDYWEEKQKNTMDLIEKDYLEFVSRKQRTQINTTELHFIKV